MYIINVESYRGCAVGISADIKLKPTVTSLPAHLRETVIKRPAIQCIVVSIVPGVHWIATATILRPACRPIAVAGIMQLEPLRDSWRPAAAVHRQREADPRIAAIGKSLHIHLFRPGKLMKYATT